MTEAEPQPGLGALEGFRQRCLDVEALALTDLAEAELAAEELVDAAESSGHAEPCARARRVRAVVHVWNNRFDESLDDLDVAFKCAEQTGDLALGAEVRMSRVHALARLGRLDDAWHEGDAARAGFEAAGVPAGSAKALANLGVVHRMRNDAPRALEALDAAHTVLADDVVASAQVQSNRAEVLLELDRFVEAEEAFLAARSVLDQAGSNRAAAIVGGNLADLMRRQGRLGPALRAFEDARIAFEREGIVGDAARIVAEQADAFAAADLRTEAAAAYRAALPPLESAGLAQERARALLGLGVVLARLNHFEDAAKMLGAAGEAFEVLGHALGRGRVDVALAELALQRGAPDDARAAVDRAADALRDRPAERGVALELEARIALARGSTAEAERAARAAAEVGAELDLAPLSAAAARVLAEVAERDGRADDALAALQVAGEALERQRSGLQADRLRLALDVTLAGVGEATAALTLERGSPAQSFLAIERTKGRALLDLVAGTLDTDEVTASSETARDAIRLRREVSLLGGRLWELDADATERRAELRASISDRLRRLSTLEARLAAAQGPPGVLAPPADLEQVQQDLRPDEALVEYAMIRGRLHAIVLRPDAAPVTHDLAPSEAVFDALEELRFEVGRAVTHDDEEGLVQDGEAALAQLRSVVVESLVADLGQAARVHVVPHGALHEAPFAALLDDRLVTSTPSATLRLRLARRCVGPAIIVGVPDERAPRIEREVDVVSSAIGEARVYLGDEATLERLREAVRGAGLVHLACHGRFDPRSPMSSALRLAGRGEGAGGREWVGAHDIATLPLAGALIVLSGCETGRAAIGGGDDLLGLVRGFFAAGAAGLIMASWPLPDESAMHWMASFHAAWQNGTAGLGLAEAFQCASRTVRHEVAGRFRHPVHWAPYMLIGRG